MKIKVALAGAYGNLGSDIFKELIKKGLAWLPWILMKEIWGLQETIAFTK